MFNIFIIVFMFSAFIGCVFTFWKINNESKYIHGELDKIEKVVKSSESINELLDAYKNLVEISKKCWHHTYNTRVRVIESIIQTKLNHFESV